MTNLTRLAFLFPLAIVTLGCGRMLDGRMYTIPKGPVYSFQIETSYGNGKLVAVNPATKEIYSGEYTAISKGQEMVAGSIGGTAVMLNKIPLNANAYGILRSEKGTTIRLYFEINKGFRPTGHGLGEDEKGNKYEVYF